MNRIRRLSEPAAPRPAQVGGRDAGGRAGPFCRNGRGRRRHRLFVPCTPDMQTSADMAALAGAQDINSGRRARRFRPRSRIAASPATATPTRVGHYDGNRLIRRCGAFSSTGMSCTGPDSANGIVVKQQTDVPLFFARVFGNSTMPVSVTSVASKGRAPKPADVIIVLDTTASMDSPDPSCSISGATQVKLRFWGNSDAAFGFSPTQNRVGLMIFPGPDVDRGGRPGIRLQP